MNQRIYIFHPPNREWERNMGGIYKITFGHRFYIGKTRLLVQRLISHEKKINKAIEYYPDRVHEIDSNMYFLIAKHLVENPKIRVGYIELIQPCATQKEMDYWENEILWSMKDNSDLLNMGRHLPVLTRRENKPLPSCKVYEYYRWFYNPETGEEVMELDEITSKGTKRIKTKYGDDYQFKCILQNIVSKYGRLH